MNIQNIIENYIFPIVVALIFLGSKPLWWNKINLTRYYNPTVGDIIRLFIVLGLLLLIFFGNVLMSAWFSHQSMPKSHPGLGEEEKVRAQFECYQTALDMTYDITPTIDREIAELEYRNDCLKDKGFR